MTDYLLALDISLCSTGLCVYWADGDNRVTTIETAAKDWQPGLGRFGRYGEIVRRVLDFVPTGYSPRGIFIEGYSFGSKGQAVINIAELGGLMRNRLLSVFAGVPMWEIAPTSLKKFSTGRSLADKAAMAVAASKRYDFEHASSDAIDAYLLARLGACIVLGHEPATEFQREVIEGILQGPKPKRKRGAA